MTQSEKEAGENDSCRGRNLSSLWPSFWTRTVVSANSGTSTSWESLCRPNVALLSGLESARLLSLEASASRPSRAMVSISESCRDLQQTGVCKSCLFSRPRASFPLPVGQLFRILFSGNPAPRTSAVQFARALQHSICCLAPFTFTATTDYPANTFIGSSP